MWVQGRQVESQTPGSPHAGITRGAQNLPPPRETIYFFLHCPDSILKSRDITLPKKVRLVKAMVFPVVMYGCESWTVKKAER